MTTSDKYQKLINQINQLISRCDDGYVEIPTEWYGAIKDRRYFDLKKQLSCVRMLNWLD